MKNICILKGSPRKNGNTNALVRVIKNELETLGHIVSEYDLYDMDIKPCLACRECQKDWSKINCVQNDELTIIADELMKSDLIILASPVYSWYCTPPMKAALDRFVYMMNMYYGEKKGPALWEGKNIAIVTTCGYRPEKGADLWEEGVKRYCKHSQLEYKGMLCERHMGYKTVFMDEGKNIRAKAFARDIMKKI